VNRSKSRQPLPAESPRGYSPAWLAKRWNCCRQTIYNMLRDGELHSYTVRGCRRIPLSEIERIEAGGEV
jgi:excisionase family DNA binding protein